MAHINLWHAGGSIAAGCGIALLIVSAFPMTDPDDVLKARAAMQEAQWRLLEEQDKAETQAANYAALMAELSAYQDDHVCVPKKP